MRLAFAAKIALVTAAGMMAAPGSFGRRGDQPFARARAGLLQHDAVFPHRRNARFAQDSLPDFNTSDFFSIVANMHHSCRKYGPVCAATWYCRVERGDVRS